MRDKNGTPLASVERYRSMTPDQLEYIQALLWAHLASIQEVVDARE